MCAYVALNHTEVLPIIRSRAAKPGANEELFERRSPLVLPSYGDFHNESGCGWRATDQGEGLPVIEASVLPMHQ